jgi:hypothetical protein
VPEALGDYLRVDARVEARVAADAVAAAGVDHRGQVEPALPGGFLARASQARNFRIGRTADKTGRHGLVLARTPHVRAIGVDS